MHSPWGHKESDMTEQLSYIYIHDIGGETSPGTQSVRTLILDFIAP